MGCLASMSGVGKHQNERVYRSISAVGNVYRSDKHTDHRLSVNLHDRPTADGSIVDDEWCVLMRWARVNTDH